MMNKLLPFFLLAVTAIVSFKTDNDGIQTITEKLEKFRKDYPQEKVHLHFDKPVYSIGDTMFFKAYVVNAEKNMPSTISNILYVDITNEHNDTEQKVILLPIADGVSEGSMVLNDTLSGGTYLVRAYTNWMRNFDKENFYHRDMIVGNALNNEVQMHTVFKPDSANANNLIADINYATNTNEIFSNKEVKYSITNDGKEVQKGKTNLDESGNFSIDLSRLQKNQSYELVTNLKEDKKTEVTKTIQFNLPAASHNVQFFPEGGQMINGLQSRIGFKAVDVHGEGIDISGKIIDETGKQIVDFTSAFAGMGSFTFTPQPSHTYTATIKFKNGSEEKSPLPAAENQGYELALENQSNENINVHVSAKGNVSNDVILIAQCNNKIQYTQQVSLINNTLTEQISTKKFPTGIIQFTIFDAALKPMAERLVFVNHSDQLRINMNQLKNAYNKKEPVKITFNAKDEDGNPVNGNFSVSVTNSNIFPADKNMAPTIVSDLLLTSDLKGYIENPNYYFSIVNEKKIKELDNLMLTQGWRRFKWTQILSDQYPATPFLVDKNLRISGQILNHKNQPAANAKVILMSKGGNGFTLSTEANANGDFAFENLDFSDNIPVVIQAFTADSSHDVVIKMNGFSVPVITGNQYLNNVATESGTPIKNYLTQSQKRFDEWRKYGLIPENTKVLKEVKIAAKPITKQQEAVTGSYNLNGPGNADQIFTYEDLKNYGELSKFIPGHALGLYIKIDGKTLQQLVYSTRGTGAPMAIYIDGIFIGSNIDAIPAYDVQSIEILRSGGFLNVYGMNGASGVIVITTKRGGIDYDDFDNVKKKAIGKGLLFTNVKGYAKIRQFYSPGDDVIHNNTIMRDLRTTLYWKPIIKTDDDGNATIEFNNGDVAGKYNITIEGITEFGKTGSASFIYEVK